jgi:hypothetical protein
MYQQLSPTNLLSNPKGFVSDSWSLWNSKAPSTSVPQNCWHCKCGMQMQSWDSWCFSASEWLDLSIYHDETLFPFPRFETSLRVQSKRKHEGILENESPTSVSGSEARLTSQDALQGGCCYICIRRQWLGRMSLLVHLLRQAHPEAGSGSAGRYSVEPALFTCRGLGYSTFLKAKIEGISQSLHSSGVSLAARQQWHRISKISLAEGSKIATRFVSRMISNVKLFAWKETRAQIMCPSITAVSQLCTHHQNHSRWM